jgi:hypothetical protein
MKIVCFEDDSIDQKLFERVASSFDGVEFSYYNSLHGLNETYLNSYDGIIMDQYLEDGGIDDLTKLNIKVPIAVLSASGILKSSIEFETVGVWQKPIRKNVLEEIIKMFPSSPSDEIISIEYIKDLCQGNVDEMKQLIADIYESMSIHQAALLDHASLDAENVRHHLHNQKSKVGIFYLEDLHAKIDVAENSLKDGKQLSEIQDVLQEILRKSQNVLEQIKNYLEV